MTLLRLSDATVSGGGGLPASGSPLMGATMPLAPDIETSTWLQLTWAHAEHDRRGDEECGEGGMRRGKGGEGEKWRIEQARGDEE
eukprot:214460-Chlamydomonas_euryale.AAC.1